ncbi:hypothetical protein ACFL27_04630 [candidate division CSSED10-310 bacterium]|uniref:Lipoprotein n=1 Tax=candidate division CSSED10-310 bacterium TaxID=2855610 RepID=A0ABV6YTS4_UNCC1
MMKKARLILTISCWTCLIVAAALFVACADHHSTSPALPPAVLACDFDPGSSVEPVYENGIWKWYVQAYNVHETKGIGIQLTKWLVTGFLLEGSEQFSYDFSKEIVNYFGTDYLPESGSVRCELEKAWFRTTGDGVAWQMQFYYEGIDDFGNAVTCECWITCQAGS